MKLLKKTTLYFLFITSLSFIFSSFFAFYGLQYLINSEVDESLRLEMNQVTAELEKKSGLVNLDYTPHLTVRVLPSISNEIRQSTGIKDTLLYDVSQQEQIPYRQLTAIKQIGGHPYQIKIRLSLLEKKDLVWGITTLLAAIFVPLLLILGLFNYFGDKKIWRPFHSTLRKIQKFDFTQDRKLKLDSANINEFDELNRVLSKMAEKLQKDYINLKELSENAAHEMQTPLAIIKSKLELLIQDTRLQNDQLAIIQATNNAAGRLTALIRGLNLLTKIENQEFSNREKINIGQLIDLQLENLEEIIKIKKIEVQKVDHQPFILNIHPMMAEILISNLLTNAVKHNVRNGFIRIEIYADKLILGNSGNPLKTAPEKLFERFRKGNSETDSPGLGLAIVKKICENNSIQIHYVHQKLTHQIQITR